MNECRHRMYLINARDDLLRELWQLYRELSDVQEPENWSENDLDLWEMVTNHSAIQDKIRKH